MRGLKSNELVKNISEYPCESKSTGAFSLFLHILQQNSACFKIYAWVLYVHLILSISAYYTEITVLSGHLKIDTRKVHVLIDNGSLKNVESIVEAFCNKGELSAILLTCIKR